MSRSRLNTNRKATTVLAGLKGGEPLANPVAVIGCRRGLATVGDLTSGERRGLCGGHAGLLDEYLDRSRC